MTVERTRAERLGDALTGWVDRLPPRLRAILPKSLVLFALLGAFTFSIDLGVLSMLKHWTHLPFVVAVAIGYIAAFSVNFLLNRTVNFKSHAPVGRQAARYAVVSVADFLITVGATSGLHGLGLDFRVARVTASVVVAVFTYSASRWWVFRDHLASAPAGAEAHYAEAGRPV